jgi:hypothetical protein
VFPEVEDDTAQRLHPSTTSSPEDEDHTYDYVVEMLMKIFSMTRRRLSCRGSGSAGTTILLTCELQKAELKRDQIHAFGADWAGRSRVLWPPSNPRHSR